MTEWNEDVPICANCEFFMQGKNSCVCGNPANVDGYKQYTYWPFKCNHFTKSKFGEMTHKQKIEAGYIYDKKEKTYGFPIFK